MQQHNIFTSLAEGRFRWYWTSTLFTYAAAQMDATIKGWLIFRITGSAADLGIVTLAGGIPLIIGSLFGGLIADRRDRMKSLLVTQAVALTLAVTTCLLLATGAIQYWHFIALAAAQGLMFAFIAPLRQSITARLVRPENLASAVALNSTSYNIMGIIGPASVGLMLTTLLPQQVYFAIIACYICGAAMLAFIRIPEGNPQPSRPLYLDLSEGFSFIRRDRLVLGLLLTALVCSLFCIPYIYMLPALAYKVLKVDQAGFGFLCAAAGTGALLGSLAAAPLTGLKHKGLLVMAFVAAFGAFITLASQGNSYQAALLFVLLASLAATACLVLCNTLVLKNTPPPLHGRVISVYTMTMAFTPLGGLPMGAAADAIGLPATFIAAGAIAIISTASISLTTPGLRRAD